jgi:hypothetical protein
MSADEGPSPWALTAADRVLALLEGGEPVGWAIAERDEDGELFHQQRWYLSRNNALEVMERWRKIHPQREFALCAVVPAPPGAHAAPPQGGTET